MPPRTKKRKPIVIHYNGKDVNIFSSVASRYGLENNQTITDRKKMHKIVHENIVISLGLTNAFLNQN